jgi:hypothetical protein
MDKAAADVMKRNNGMKDKKDWFKGEVGRRSRVNNRSRSVIVTIVARLSLATDLNSGPAILNIASLVGVSKQYTRAHTAYRKTAVTKSCNC